MKSISFKMGIEKRSFLTLGLLVVLSACGQSKGKNDAVVVVGENKVDDKTKESFVENISPWISNDGYTIDQLNNLISKAPIGDDKKKSALDFIMSMDSNHDSIVTNEELNEGIKKAAPSSRWVDSTENIDWQTLSQRMSISYPDASVTAREALARQMMRFDLEWIGGNRDSKVSQNEIQLAGILVGAVVSSDIVGDLGCTSGPNAVVKTPEASDDSDTDEDTAKKLSPQEQKALTKFIGIALDKAIFLRYPVLNFCDLPTADLMLEISSIALELYIENYYLGNVQKSDIDEDQLEKVLEQLSMSDLVPENKDFSNLIAFYDRPILNGKGTKAEDAVLGDGNGKLSLKELFMMSLDLRYSKKLLQAFDEKSAVKPDKAKHVYSVSEGTFKAVPLIQAHLHGLYPNVYESIFGTAEKPNKDFWKKFARTFDSPKRGGNGDGALTEVELLTGMNQILMTEMFFSFYDNNAGAKDGTAGTADGFITKAEINPLLDSVLGKNHDPKIVELIFSEAITSNASNPFDLFFDMNKPLTKLSAFQIYQRLLIIDQFQN